MLTYRAARQNIIHALYFGYSLRAMEFHHEMWNKIDLGEIKLRDYMKGSCFRASGFVPPPEENRVPPEVIVDLINRNRVCPIPFRLNWYCPGDPVWANAMRTEHNHLLVINSFYRVCEQGAWKQLVGEILAGHIKQYRPCPPFLQIKLFRPPFRITYEA